REKVAALRRLQSQSQSSTSAQGDFDLICGTIEGGTAVAVVVNVRGGINLGHRSLFPRAPSGTEVPKMMNAFINQYYIDRPVPAEILVDPLPVEAEPLAASLARRAGHRVQIRNNVRGKRRKWLDNTRMTLQQSVSA